MAAQLSKQASASSKEDSVIGTNNSSIVSKRSVERTYYDEPHFFRYFVKKPLRRSPLINRGYWLRMHAVHHVVRQFLEEPSSKRKVIINLGCGYDPLPFQWLSKEPDLCRDVLFVDVDYPQLVSRKVEIILANPPLYDLLGPIKRGESSGNPVLQSPNYLVVGCDLSDTSKLERSLSASLDFSSSMVLCTAEVAITYMSVDAADSLIQWAAMHDDIRFCLLEQFLPAGPDHAFAKTMIKHFEKLHTPLRSISSYPTLEDQKRRFRDRGWSISRAQSLWDFWCDDSGVNIELRKFVEGREPFDEWEEFILFCSHYFIILCTNSNSNVHAHQSNPSSKFDTRDDLSQDLSMSDFDMQELSLDQHTSRGARKRFGAAYGSGTSFAYFGGIAERSRDNKTNAYELTIHGSHHGGIGQAFSPAILPDTITARACHAIASTGDGKYLLAGGRASPTRPMQDCWYFDQQSWSRIRDLPFPLYRHTMTWVNTDGFGLGVLLYGGKSTENFISNQWLFWQREIGWQQLTTAGQHTEPVFGAAIGSTGTCEGLLLGGITQDGVIQHIPFTWRLELKDQRWTITLSETSFDSHRASGGVSRFGAQLVQMNSNLILAGGLSNNIASSCLDVLLIQTLNKEHGIREVQIVSCSSLQGRPLLTGHSALTLGRTAVIMGGGATCFSFGTFWNDQAFLLTPKMYDPVHQLRPIQVDAIRSEHVADNRAVTAAMHRGVGTTSRENLPASNISSPGAVVPRFDFAGNPAPSFTEIMQTRSPAVLHGIHLGACHTQWSLEYLKDKIGRDREVIVHVADARQMDFLRKTFDYTRKKFATFADEIAAGSPQYLRSLATGKPESEPASIPIDFPQIADDFQLPASLNIVSERQHSSILRISGPVDMWLHYDVMANILCQIRGKKRVLLYPPSDVSLFSIPPGASSSSVNVFASHAMQLYPSLSSADAHEVALCPGEILYIPPLWLHAVSPEDPVSISANVFFRELSGGYAPGKDVYGNRDVHAYEKGRKEVDRLVSSFDKLPADMARFYLERLSNELLEKAHSF